jgi:hypothetical protein
VPTQSPFTGTSGNSVFEIQLFKDGLVGTARLRCIACWRVNFLTFWSPTHIQVQYREAGFVPILVSDGDRLWVECTDVELVTAATASPPPTPS